MLFSAIAPLALLVASANASFRGRAIRPDAPFSHWDIVAHDGELWIGGQTNAFCPLTDKDVSDDERNILPCPQGGKTGFIYLPGDNAVDMAVLVPGSQHCKFPARLVNG
jgi:hypothetical protein